MEVQLITVESTPVVAYNAMQYSMHEIDLHNSTRVERSPIMIPNQFVKRLDMPIIRWCENTPDECIETLYAVHPDVKKMLLNIDHKDLVYEFNKEIVEQNTLYRLARKKEETANKELYRISKSTIWERIVMVFTGVKVCFRHN